MYGIISWYDCKWYALKREVAVCVTGNFRRVCPILKPGDKNKCAVAAELKGATCVVCWGSCEPKLFLDVETGSVVAKAAPKPAFSMAHQETPGTVYEDFDRPTTPQI